jgi:acyl-[acyl-carrier-protein]-phospholipid O-acyltransferase/long-chain-fatty-acid--[acyl-carrier-protein] ligase
MTFWALMELVSTTRHSYSYIGLENIPDDKAVLLLGNHVSWLDWIIIQLPMKRQINFLMDKNIYNWPIFHSIFKLGKAIPVSSKASKDAFIEAYQRLQDGNIVALFPEGEITRDGAIRKFYKGYELIPTNYDGVIIPFFIAGMFGSLFSRYKPKDEKSFFQRREISVYFGEALPKNTTADELKIVIQNMKDKYEVKQA